MNCRQNVEDCSLTRTRGVWSYDTRCLVMLHVGLLTLPHLWRCLWYRVQKWPKLSCSWLMSNCCTAGIVCGFFTCVITYHHSLLVVVFIFMCILITACQRRVVYSGIDITVNDVKSFVILKLNSVACLLALWHHKFFLALPCAFTGYVSFSVLLAYLWWFSAPVWSLVSSTISHVPTTFCIF